MSAGELAGRVRPGRTIVGMAAVLLPFADDAGTIDWAGFEAHLGRTVAAGLVPAVNMDTGFGPSLADADRRTVLAVAQRVAPEFVAGAFVDDRPGDRFDPGGYAASIEVITAHGGTPIVFPSFGLAAVPEGDLVDAHSALARDVDQFLGFELGAMFHPAGRIWSVETFEAMLALPELIGAKHSSLQRAPELERLAVRDRIRPDFLVLTGNDLAIDQVRYGADYLLGLATFAPDAFAARDRAWAQRDDLRFTELNDLLQYLGQLAFRPPVPGYRHDAAMFLAERGWIAGTATHPGSPTRPDSDRALLADIAARLEDLLADG